MSSAASVGGLISGIDTNSILDQLYQLARAPIQRLEAEKETLNTQSVAWSHLEARLINFRTNACQLASPAGFLVYAAATSHPDLVTATASSSAVAGTYTLNVQALAQTHQLGSQGYADTDQTEVGSGTVSITVGDGDPTVIDVDDFTLAELRDAINDADAGVSAAIINDGSDTDPYRLLLTSKTGGLDGEMSLGISLSGGTAPTFSDVQPAQDAEIKLGSGAGAITISSGSNTFDDVIQGVTFTALDADPTTTVTLTVTRDNQAIQSRITDLVETYNSLASATPSSASPGSMPLSPTSESVSTPPAGSPPIPQSSPAPLPITSTTSLMPSPPSAAPLTPTSPSWSPPPIPAPPALRAGRWTSPKPPARPASPQASPRPRLSPPTKPSPSTEPTSTSPPA